MSPKIGAKKDCDGGECMLEVGHTQSPSLAGGWVCLVELLKTGSSEGSRGMDVFGDEGADDEL